MTNTHDYTTWRTTYTIGTFLCGCILLLWTFILCKNWQAMKSVKKSIIILQYIALISFTITPCILLVHLNDEMNNNKEIIEFSIHETLYDYYNGLDATLYTGLLFYVIGKYTVYVFLFLRLYFVLINTCFAYTRRTNILIIISLIVYLGSVLAIIIGTWPNDKNKVLIGIGAIIWGIFDCIFMIAITFLLVYKLHIIFFKLKLGIPRENAIEISEKTSHRSFETININKNNDDSVNAISLPPHPTENDESVSNTKSSYRNNNITMAAPIMEDNTMKNIELGVPVTSTTASASRTPSRFVENNNNNDNNDNKEEEADGKKRSTRLDVRTIFNLICQLTLITLWIVLSFLMVFITVLLNLLFGHDGGWNYLLITIDCVINMFCLFLGGWSITRNIYNKLCWIPHSWIHFCVQRCVKAPLPST